MSFVETRFSELADDSNMFDLAPVSLWLEDASGVKELFESWKSIGMTSLRERLMQPECIFECLSRLNVIKINQKTIDLFEADSALHVLENIKNIVTVDGMACIIDQWIQLWDGNKTFFGKTVNTTLKGRKLDVQIRGNILPGHEHNWDRVLITIEDVTDLENARRAAAASERYARDLFDNSPVALWVKDFSEVKSLLEMKASQGIVNLEEYFKSDPGFARQCGDAVKIIDFNRQATHLFGAFDKESLAGILFRHENQRYVDNLSTEIVGLWEGKLRQQKDVIDQTIGGQEVEVERHLCVLSGHEDDWRRVQIARIDISKRKQAETQLKYAGSHDPLTGLFNRAYLNEALARFECLKIHPISFLMIDLNGLKLINDAVGHSAGDEMLRRTGRILLNLAKSPLFATRIGGDEFLLVMPGFAEEASELMQRELEQCVERDNETCRTFMLRLAIGIATSRAGEPLEATMGRADLSMYARKALFYKSGTGQMSRAGLETYSI